MLVQCLEYWVTKWKKLSHVKQVVYYVFLEKLFWITWDIWNYLSLYSIWYFLWNLQNLFFSVNFRTTLAIYFFILLCAITLRLLCADVELNPGRKNKSCYNFSLYHLNLNGITAVNFSKILPFEIFYAQYKSSMMGLSETYLDTRFPDDNPRVHLPCCNLTRADNRYNTKRGGACVYFKVFLDVCSVTYSYLKKCLLLGVFIQNKKSYVASL